MVGEPSLRPGRPGLQRPRLSTALFVIPAPPATDSAVLGCFVCGWKECLRFGWVGVFWHFTALVSRRSRDRS